jgi:hypothetical protein
MEVHMTCVAQMARLCFLKRATWDTKRHNLTYHNQVKNKEKRTFKISQLKRELNLEVLVKRVKPLRKISRHCHLISKNTVLNKEAIL